MPVLSSISSSKPSRREPPPVRTMPRSTISAASSGGVFSSTACTLSTISEAISPAACRTSSELIRIVLGSPVTTSRPVTGIVRMPDRSQTVPTSFLTDSARLSPM